MLVQLNVSDTWSSSAVNAATTTRASSVSSTSTTASTPAAVCAEKLFLQRGFPDPLYVSSDHPLAAFATPDELRTAVLFIVAFVPGEQPWMATEFQTLDRQFLVEMKARAFTDLIIDVRSNPEGMPYLAFDLYKQLLPSAKLYSATRFRAHPAVNALGTTISATGSSIDG